MPSRVTQAQWELIQAGKVWSPGVRGIVRCVACRYPVVDHRFVDGVCPPVDLGSRLTFLGSRLTLSATYMRIVEAAAVEDAKKRLKQAC